MCISTVRGKLVDSLLLSIIIHYYLHIYDTGVFGPEQNIQWCVVVTTPVEVHLCALAGTDDPTSSARNMNNSDSANSNMEKDASSTFWNLIPTSFVVPTDGIRMLAVAGTDRIFLGGEDGCLYEMAYEGRVSEKALQRYEQGVDFPLAEYLDRFYDQDKLVPSQITTDAQQFVVSEGPAASLGKRVFASAADAPQPRKCRKLNRSATPLVQALLPDFMTSLFRGKKSPIRQLHIDEHRQTLYTLQANGWICTYDIRPPSFRLAAVLDTPKTARLYLEAVARGQSFPPNTHLSHTLGAISFPGGSAAAQVGVGGMDGARTILKARQASEWLQPIALHILDPAESCRLTAVAVTAGGLRFYLSSLTSTVVQHGPASQPPQKSRSALLAPASRISFCHVRVPPALEDLSMHNRMANATTATRVGAMQDAILPRLSQSQPQKVQASAYRGGCWVAAVQPPSSNSNSSAQQGSVLMATCPDSVARKVDVSDKTEEERKSLQDQVHTPGGLSEAVSLPMEAGQDDTSDPENATSNGKTIVPNGVIWDMAILPADSQSAVWNLMMQSQTPTESELRAGLPPAYFPASRVRARTMGETPTAMNFAAQGALVTANDNDNSGVDVNALTILRNVVTNLIFSRPIRNGIVSPRALTVSPQPELCYRISKRDGSNGFSMTAGERTKMNTTSTSARRALRTTSSMTATRSARLRLSLLKPWPVALDRLSIQHLLSRPQQMVALNVGGLHYFQMDSLLENLAKAILAAGGNVKQDPEVSKFFTSYGYKEGCSMCLALAVGCGPSATAMGSEEVKRRAMDAALARAFVPKLIVPDTSSSNTYQSTNLDQAEQLVPAGYEFKPSALCEALTMTFSRLVRPIWNRPAVVVTEGPLVRQQWSTRPVVAPAKVEILMDEHATEEINRPLRNLQALMKSKLGRAVQNVPGVSQHPDRMDVDDSVDQTHYLTRVLQYDSQQGHSGEVVQLTAAGAKNIAHLIEEKNIHSLYRLLSRVVQLLNLITLLRHAQASTELREVDWGLLHGLTFAQLAQTTEGQDRLETLLNALVTASASDRSLTTVGLSAQADQLANTFAEQCYLFFSPGSRYAYLGLRKASNAFASHPSSSQRVRLAREASSYFHQAAKHWLSAALISGRILHKKGQETPLQIAERAMQYGSPLAKAVDVLIQLADVDSAVSICLAVASNFKQTGSGQERLVDNFGAAQTYDLAWEQNLYHKRRDITENGETNGSRGSPFGNASPSSSSHIGAYGVDVSARDAVDTCYALIFYKLSQLLETRNMEALAGEMVSVCAGAADSDFLTAFFSHLLNSGHTDTLLKINSPELEKWLQQKGDADILGRYYTVQGRLVDAGDILMKKAVDATSQLPLSERIACLSKACKSYQIALARKHRAVGFVSDQGGGLESKHNLAREFLQIANIQSRILHTLDSLGPGAPSDITEEDHMKLKKGLVPTTELYNDFAVKMDLFEICLEMLRICRNENPEALDKLGKHVISKEILPCATRRDASYSFLQSFVAEIRRGSDVRNESDAGASLPIFETCYWAKGLESKMIDLGRVLYEKNNNYVFPLPFLISHLEGMWLTPDQFLETTPACFYYYYKEPHHSFASCHPIELRRTVPNILSPGWTLLIFAKVGVEFLVVLDAYEQVLLRENQSLLSVESDRERMAQLEAMVELLEFWVSSAQSSSNDNKSREQLTRAVTSGHLTFKLDAIKSSLENSAIANSALLERVKKVEHNIQYVA